MAEHKTEDTLVTFRLGSILQDILGDLDFTPLHIENAQMIALVCKDKTHIHVQFNDLDTEKPLIKPLLWNKKAWDTLYKKWLNDKKRSERERKMSNINTENIERIARWLSKRTGLPYNEAYETGKLMFFQNLKSKNFAFFRELGITIEEYNEQNT
jgi:hypothetical protein